MGIGVGILEQKVRLDGVIGVWIAHSRNAGGGAAVVGRRRDLDDRGRGLRGRVYSLGGMRRDVTRADVLWNYQWCCIPVIFFMAWVRAFVFVGDGLRDAADPYASTKK